MNHRHLVHNAVVVQTKRAVFAAAAIATVLAIAGCGSSSSIHEAGPVIEPLINVGSASRDLEVWLRDLRAEEVEVRSGAIDPIEFRPARPPPKAELQSLNQEGWSMGFDTWISTLDMQRLSDLRQGEAGSFTCFVFDWYLGHPNAIPSAEEFEEFMFHELVNHALSPNRYERLAGKFNRFRLGIFEARSAPEAVGRIALATFCSLSKD